MYFDLPYDFVSYSYNIPKLTQTNFANAKIRVESLKQQLMRTSWLTDWKRSNREGALKIYFRVG